MIEVSAIKRIGCVAQGLKADRLDDDRRPDSVGDLDGGRVVPARSRENHEQGMGDRRTNKT
jgi:hypothetical protein